VETLIIKVNYFRVETLRIKLNSFSVNVIIAKRKGILPRERAFFQGLSEEKDEE
jgi:hypothetical protein